MRPPLRLTLLALLALLALGLVLVLVVGSTRQSATREPTPPSSLSSSAAGAISTSGFAGAALPGGIVAPAWTLTSASGERVSLSDYRGRVLILTFLTPTAGVSQLIAQQIRGALDDLGGHPVPAVAISVAPQLDTRARIERFLAANALSGRLTYLTGSAARLRSIWSAYHVVPFAAGRARFENAATVLLIDARGDERVLFGAEQLTPQGLAHDVQRLRG